MAVNGLHLLEVRPLFFILTWLTHVIAILAFLPFFERMVLAAAEPKVDAAKRSAFGINVFLATLAVVLLGIAVGVAFVVLAVPFALLVFALALCIIALALWLFLLLRSGLRVDGRGSWLTSGIELSGSTAPLVQALKLLLDHPVYSGVEPLVVLVGVVVNHQIVF